MTEAQQKGPLVAGLVSEPPRKRPRISIFHFLVLITGLVLGVGLAWWNADLFVPEYLEGRRPGRVSACAANLTRIGIAIEAYSKEHGMLPESQYDLVPDYLKKLPDCPSAHRMSYRTSFGPYAGNNKSADPHYFLVECCGENHKGALMAPDFPTYDSNVGLMFERGW